jgi:hypothetical protein
MSNFRQIHRETGFLLPARLAANNHEENPTLNQRLDEL